MVLFQGLKTLGMIIMEGFQVCCSFRGTKLFFTISVTAHHWETDQAQTKPLVAERGDKWDTSLPMNLTPSHLVPFSPFPYPCDQNQ